MNDLNWPEHIEHLRFNADQLAERLPPIIGDVPISDWGFALQHYQAYATTLLALERAERWRSDHRRRQIQSLDTVRDIVQRLEDADLLMAGCIGGSITTHDVACKIVGALLAEAPDAQ